MPDPAAANEPLLKVDFSKGEQFWKFWVSKKVKLDDDQIVRFKILSRKGIPPQFDVICLTELEDGRKIIWAEGYWRSDAELVSFVRGIHAALVAMIGHGIEIELIDLSECKTYEDWNYTMHEATTAKLWEVGDGASVRGDF
jgi:hypothetical protein